LKIFQKLIWFYSILNPIQIQFENIQTFWFWNQILESIQKAFLQPSYSFDNFGPKTVFPAQTISFVLLCIGPVAASSLAQSAPTSSFHWLPTPASIGTTAPPAVSLCRAPLTAALLHAQRAKPKRHHAAFTPPTESSPSCLFFPL
jgi:hypothetical protein